jgi:hypothetical protein
MAEIRGKALFRDLTPQPPEEGRTARILRARRFVPVSKSGRAHPSLSWPGTLRRDQRSPDGTEAKVAAGQESTPKEIHLALRRINSRIWSGLRVGALAGCHALLYTIRLEEGGEVLEWRQVNRRLVSPLHGFESSSTDNERYRSLTEALDRIGQKLQIVNMVAASKGDCIPEEQEELEQDEAELWRLSRLLGSWPCRRGSE